MAISSTISTVPWASAATGLAGDIRGCPLPLRNLSESSAGWPRSPPGGRKYGAMRSLPRASSDLAHVLRISLALLICILAQCSHHTVAHPRPRQRQRIRQYGLDKIAEKKVSKTQ